MFDPTYPPANAEIESAPLRGQFTSLKALIDALSSINAAQVDSVSTLPPGSAAAVGLGVVGTTLHFTFGLPQGAAGADGAPGAPFANAVVDGVNTLPPGSAATVNVFFDGTLVHFTFGIPQGNTGAQGNDGGVGPQGLPGEVTLAQLQAESLAVLNACSSNSNAVGTIPNVAPVNYDQATMQLLIDKMNELINALRR